VVEFSEDNTGYLQTTEWPIYVFDALLIFVAMVIFNILHPGRFLTANQDVAKSNATNKNQTESNKMPSVSVTK
jgi:hypothetical protein